MLFSQKNKGQESQNNIQGNIIEGSDARFQTEIIAPSMEKPVLVDFYAPWCGPCKQLTPLLEKIAREQPEDIVLVKINTDDHPALAAQLSIQSLPTVVVFYQGRPVESFTGALPESHLREFVKKLLSLVGGGGEDVKQMLDMARTARESGNDAEAISFYGQILAQDTTNIDALAGLCTVYADRGEMKKVEGFLKNLSAEMRQHKAITALLKRIDFLRDVEKNPQKEKGFHGEKRSDAQRLYKEGEVLSGFTCLLESIKEDRKADEGASHKLYLRMLETLLPDDVRLASARKALSSVLFS